MTAASVLRAVREQWLLVVLVALLAVAAASVALVVRTPEYRSTATMVIAPNDTLDSPDAIVRSFETLQHQGIVPTLVELLTSSGVKADSGEEIGLSGPELDRYDLSAAVLSDSNYIEVVVAGPEPGTAAELAERVTADSAELFESLYQVYDVRPVDPPVAATTPYRPVPQRDLPLALGLGIAAGLLAAVVRAEVSTRRQDDARPRKRLLALPEKI